MEPRLQASSYELLLDRRVGGVYGYQVPDNVWVVAAGNSVDDGAIAYEIGSALADRVVHFKVVCEPEQWIKWATANNIAHEVLTFIKVKPDYLIHGQAFKATNNTSDNLIVPTPRKLQIAA